MTCVGDNLRRDLSQICRRALTAVRYGHTVLGLLYLLLELDVLVTLPLLTQVPLHGLAYAAPTCCRPPWLFVR